MGASTSVASSIFGLLAKGFDKEHGAVQEDRQFLAKKIYKIFEQEDFNDDDLDCYEQLITLGIAKRCKHCGRGFTSWSKDNHGKDVCEAES